MSELDSTLFSGKLRLVTEEDLAKCEVNNIGEDITNVLTSFGWEGEPTACVLLQLTADNERVAAGSLVTRGQADREFIIDAGKVWQDANMGVTLTIRLPELDSFSFSDGGTASDTQPKREALPHPSCQPTWRSSASAGSARGSCASRQKTAAQQTECSGSTLTCCSRPAEENCCRCRRR